MLSLDVTWPNKLFTFCEASENSELYGRLYELNTIIQLHCPERNFSTKGNHSMDVKLSEQKKR